MSNCWAIIIGINHYQGFQPLMQAQNDAVGIRQYLIEDAGFAPENCILLSDLTTSTEHQAVFPDQVAINDWLETICQGRVQRDDTLWFYFSGYGAQADNKDYLMPVDGDPAQVKQTGIALQDVVKHLKQAPTPNTMMVLDINRSQSALAGQAIGEQVIKLARKARIPLILSCQPNEFSHETLAVRHGLFTVALLEGLRYDGCATLSHLERYLIERIPELCEHHWRPIQNPVVLLPEEHKFQLLWHQRDLSADEAVAAEAAVDIPETEFSAPDTPDSPDSESAPLIPSSPEADVMPDNPDTEAGQDADLIPQLDLALEDNLSEPPSEVLSENLSEDSQQESFSLESDEDDEGDVYGTSTIDQLPEDTPTKNRTGGCLTLLGVLVALLLLGAGILFRNQPLVQSTLEDRVPPEWLARLGLDANDGEETEGTEPAEPDPSDAEETDGAATDADEADESAIDAEAPELEDPAAEASGVDDPDADTPDAADAETGSEDDTPASGIDNPDAETDEPPTDSVAAAGNTTPPTDEIDTTELLAEARRSLRPSQASQFASAIATARQIPPGDPNYAQAQTDIQRWSQVILDLADGRAAETELDAAIDAARLIPSEPADVYQTAQERIRIWQRRAGARELIREAQSIPRIGQASTYQDGILKLQEIPEELPVEYADAQRLINAWTGKMLTIAQDRAAQGLYFSAIEAAELIPEGTASYSQAQAEIQRWQGQ